MPTYDYEAFNSVGKLFSGSINEPTHEACVDKLRNEHKLFVNKIVLSKNQPVEVHHEPTPENQPKIDLLGIPEVREVPVAELPMKMPALEEFTAEEVVAADLQTSIENIINKISLIDDMNDSVAALSKKKKVNKKAIKAWQLIYKQLPAAVSILLAEALRD